MTNGHYICRMKRKIYRENILEAGTEIMFSLGYNATGIKEITEHIGIPKGSFYNHFSSKQAFGLEVVKNYSDNGVEFHRKVLLNKTLSPLTRLNKFYSQIISEYEEVMNFKLGCVMGNFSAEMADVNDEFRKVLDIGFKQQEAIIVSCIKEAQELNEINDQIDCELTGNFLINSWHGALIRMKSTGTSEPLENFKHFIFNKILV